MKRTKFLTRGALIAASYVVLTVVSWAIGLSSGVIQCRFSEMLTVLPFFLPEAVPGLFVGCILANTLTGGAIWDILFGSLATLIGALGTYFIGVWARGKTERTKKLIAPLVPLPTVIANGVIIPPMLIFAYGASDAYWFLTLTVVIGELISAQVGGMLIYFQLLKNKNAL